MRKLLVLVTLVAALFLSTPAYAEDSAPLVCGPNGYVVMAGEDECPFQPEHAGLPDPEAVPASANTPVSGKVDGNVVKAIAISALTILACLAVVFATWPKKARH